MFSGVFRLKSRLRFAVTILIGLMFAVSPAGAMTHCLEMPHMTSSAPGQGPSGVDMHKNDAVSAFHSLGDPAHDHAKQKAGHSAGVCAGPGMALVAQCKFNVTARLVPVDFVSVVQPVLGMSVPPPSEPPRV